MMMMVILMIMLIMRLMLMMIMIRMIIGIIMAMMKRISFRRENLITLLFFLSEKSAERRDQ